MFNLKPLPCSPAGTPIKTGMTTLIRVNQDILRAKQKLFAHGSISVAFFTSEEATEAYDYCFNVGYYVTTAIQARFYSIMTIRIVESFFLIGLFAT